MPDSAEVKRRSVWRGLLRQVPGPYDELCPSNKINNQGLGLVGDTGIEPVTSSV